MIEGRRPVVERASWPQEIQERLPHGSPVARVVQVAFRRKRPLAISLRLRPVPGARPRGASRVVSVNVVEIGGVAEVASGQAASVDMRAG